MCNLKSQRDLGYKLRPLVFIIKRWIRTMYLKVVKSLKVIKVKKVQRQLRQISPRRKRKAGLTLRTLIVRYHFQNTTTSLTTLLTLRLPW